MTFAKVFWMAAGRFDAEVMRIRVAVWGDPREMRNPFRTGGLSDEEAKKQSDRAFSTVGRILGELNRRAGAV